MSIFANYKPMVARWLKLGEPQIYVIEPSDDITFKKGEWGQYILTCTDSCFHKVKFSIPLANDVEPHWETEKLGSIRAQAFIKCDYDGVPVIEDGRAIVIARVVSYIIK